MQKPIRMDALPNIVLAKTAIGFINGVPMPVRYDR